MNIALSALLVTLFLLPAFFFRIGISIIISRKKNPATNNEFHHDLIYRNFRKAFSRLSFTETIFLFSVIPIVLHLISLCCINLAGRTIDYSLLLNIFSGKNDVLNSTHPDFKWDIIYFLQYILIETLLGFLLGILLSYLVGSNQWLLRVLMGNNIWFKIFSGHSLTPEQKEQLAFIIVEVLVLTKETSIVYSGWLKHYEVVDQTDNLSYITIASPLRRDLRAAQITHKDSDAAPSTSSTYYNNSYGNAIEIPGHMFTIPGKEILSVNVTYMKYKTDPATGQKIPVLIGEPVSVVAP